MSCVSVQWTESGSRYETVSAKHPPYDGGGSGLACCALIAASNAA